MCVCVCVCVYVCNATACMHQYRRILCCQIVQGEYLAELNWVRTGVRKEQLNTYTYMYLVNTYTYMSAWDTFQVPETCGGYNTYTYMTVAKGFKNFYLNAGPQARLGLERCGEVA